jgi:signal peptidase I
MPKNKEKETEKPRETQVEFLASLAVTLVMVLFIMTFVGQTFAIPSSSMENTLLIGDHLFVNRVGFAPSTSWMGPLLPYRPIQRGQIIVFFSPAQKDLHLVKRVIGIPGDRLHLRQGVVYRNGEKLDEKYVIHSDMAGYDLYRDNFPLGQPYGGATPAWQENLPQHIEGEDIVVPENSYFAMGDNRDVSFDSRYWGFVPRENIVGQPTYIYWSFETASDEYLHTEFGDRIKSVANTVIHFFDKTRWRRTFTAAK